MKSAYSKSSTLQGLMLSKRISRDDLLDNCLQNGVRNFGSGFGNNFTVKNNF